MVQYKFAHVGLPNATPEAANALADVLRDLFGFPSFALPASTMATENIELLHSGTRPHLGIYTSDIDAAVRELRDKGVTFDEKSAAYRGGQLVSIFMAEDFGGIQIHLVQKRG